MNQASGKLTPFLGDTSLWELDYLGSYLQGARENELYFLLPSNEFICIDKVSGKIVFRLDLKNLSREGRAKGQLEVFNDTSSRNSFIANILINRDMIIWTAECDAFMAYDRVTGVMRQTIRQPNQFLVDLNDNQVMTLYVDEELGSGTLTLINMEEFLK